MKKINYNGYDYTIKVDCLTGGQVSNLVTEAIKIYVDGGLLDDYGFNPVDMEINFYAGLFYLTIENFDINDNDKFEELFKNEVHISLLNNIKNAKLAYDLMWKTANEIGNSLGFILNKIKNFLDKLPEGDKLDELMEKLPEEWKSVKDGYDEIIGENANDKRDE